jgi:hypothetical protein
MIDGLNARGGYTRIEALVPGYETRIDPVCDADVVFYHQGHIDVGMTSCRDVCGPHLDIFRAVVCSCLSSYIIRRLSPIRPVIMVPVCS